MPSCVSSGQKSKTAPPTVNYSGTIFSDMTKMIIICIIHPICVIVSMSLYVNI